MSAPVSLASARQSRLRASERSSVAVTALEISRSTSASRSRSTASACRRALSRWSCRRSSTRAMSAPRRERSTGFTTYPAAPPSTAATAESSVAWPVTIRMSTAGAIRCASFMTVIPSMSGRSRSIRWCSASRSR
ncbi:MAG: hypothetical protein A2X53_11735 [Candidatus Rokubacteria bacterium GWA2_70_23]|nr:MAG: hypothetical protein A2X53_11735 [Candidatus Rokubacteria bacterium GWA2_70_23]